MVRFDSKTPKGTHLSFMEQFSLNILSFGRLFIYGVHNEYIIPNKNNFRPWLSKLSDVVASISWYIANAMYS